MDNLDFRTRVSFAACVLDDFSGERVLNADLMLRLTESRKQPVRKNDGFFVFVDLENMAYTLTVESGVYFPQSLRVEPDRLNRLDPVVYIRLKPKPSYPFPTGATLIRGLLTGGVGTAVSDARVRAWIHTVECAKGRILQESTSKGSSTLYLARLGGAITEGETLMIGEKEQPGTELCEISRCCGDTGHFELCAPLQFSHKRGTYLFPVTETNPDRRGEIAVYFYNVRIPAFEAELWITCGSTEIHRKFEMHAGTTCRLGTLAIQSFI